MSATFSAKQCPIAAGWLKALREEFGAIEPIYLSENGVVIDKREKQVSEE